MLFGWRYIKSGLMIYWLLILSSANVTTSIFIVSSSVISWNMVFFERLIAWIKYSIKRGRYIFRQLIRINLWNIEIARMLYFSSNYDYRKRRMKKRILDEKQSSRNIFKKFSFFHFLYTGCTIICMYLTEEFSTFK